MSEPEWRAFLAEEHTAVLSSAGTRGYPHLVAMWYLPEVDGLLMWTYAKSQKTQNLRRQPQVGVLIEAGDRYDELRGVLIQANAEIIDAPDEVYRIGRALHARYAEPGEDPRRTEESVHVQATKRVAVRVPYTHVVSWDHRKLRRIAAG